MSSPSELVLGGWRGASRRPAFPSALPELLRVECSALRRSGGARAAFIPALHSTVGHSIKESRHWDEKSGATGSGR